MYDLFIRKYYNQSSHLYLNIKYKQVTTQLES